jgi:tRNA pseudouridine-54 N-methylase
MPDKSLNALMLCKDRPLTKKEILVGVGVTNQTVNVRNIINPLISAGCLAIVDEDREKVRNVRYKENNPCFISDDSLYLRISIIL